MNLVIIKPRLYRMVDSDKLTDLLCVEVSQYGEDDDTHGDDSDVISCANQWREQQSVGGRAEYVSVNLLPAILITQVFFLQK